MSRVRAGRALVQIRFGSGRSKRYFGLVLRVKCACASADLDGNPAEPNRAASRDSAKNASSGGPSQTIQEPPKRLFGMIPDFESTNELRPIAIL
jgi:hypothetical protein